MSEKCILTNLCMIEDEDRILVQLRKDPEFPGICFPGGHVEENESFVESVIREVKEETGLDIYNPVLCGVKQWMTDKQERYIVLFYKTTQFSGVLQSSEEGEMMWLTREQLTQYPLSDAFLETVKVFDDDSLSEVYFYQIENQWEHKLL